LNAGCALMGNQRPVAPCRTSQSAVIPPRSTARMNSSRLKKEYSPPRGFRVRMCVMADTVVVIWVTSFLASVVPRH
jgi:hypothetical protein